MAVQEGFFPFQGYKTYYRVVNPQGKKTPLVLLHGGPGSSHNYFESFDDLDEDRPIIMYDQIGCGQSLAPGQVQLFNRETWLAELKALREHLNLEEIHLLGQSWGGMLALLYALEGPQGVQSLILSSTLSSASLWQKEQHRRIKMMPKEEQEAIFKALKNEDFKDPEYLKALAHFMHLHCAPDFGPEDAEYLTRPKQGGAEAYLTAWGPNEFTPTGNLADYEITHRLAEITLPTLVTNGQADLSSPYISKTMVDELPVCQWTLFAYSRHMPFIEEREKYHEILNDWLNRHDL